MRTLIVSAVNVVEGGPLTALRSLLVALERQLPPSWVVKVLVNRPGLIEPGISGRMVEVDVMRGRRGWFRRLYIEYHALQQFAQREDGATVWFSFCDTTPRVGAVPQYLYCHSPAPFHRLTLRDAWLEPKLAVFRALYRSIYRFRIDRNKAVFVQQHWIRRWFEEQTAARQVVVASPRNRDDRHAPGELCLPDAKTRPVVFLYPALPRVFKNLERVVEAAITMASEQGLGPSDFRIWLTIDGTENRYASVVARRAKACACIELIGLQSREQLLSRYRAADVLLFPSRLETWGLPLNEAQSAGLPILVADKPYARETLNAHEHVEFLDPMATKPWVDAMSAFIEGRASRQPYMRPPHLSPQIEDWDGLVEFLVSQHAEP